jgi:multidrug efflux pump subunit AcrB
VLAELAVRRWQFTLVVFVALAALGLNALFAIPKSEDPTFPVPEFVVVAVLPGATPDDLERLVVDPIETRIKTLDDLDKLRTTIQDGVAVIDARFYAGVDADEKRDAVMREVNALKPTLPDTLVRLDVEKGDTTRVNLLETALVSDHASYHELERAARSLKRRLEGVHGVGDVTIAGLPKQEVRVTVDLPRLVALGVSPLELVQAISSDAQTVPGGALEAGGRRFSVTTSGDYESAAEVGDVVVRSVGGTALRVRDVADVALTDAEPTDIARFEGQRAVLVLAAQRANQNIFDVISKVRGVVDAVEAELPGSITLKRGFDQSRNVAHRLDGFARDFGLAIVLVLVTLLPLGVRASIVVMLSIPLSLAMGVFMLHVAGFGVNQISIVGFVIALGLLVDDSVVVVENITRHLREGDRPREAAIRATRQITASVLGCTATLIFAFLPLLALPGLAGEFIRGLPMALVFTILASLLVSLTIVPFLSSLLLRPEGEHGNVFFRAMTYVIEGSYRRILGHAIAHPAITLIAAAAIFAGSVALVPLIGFSVFPKAGTPQFVVEIEASQGSSLDVTDRAARFVESALGKHPEVYDVATRVGRGHPQIYYNVMPRNEQAHVADVFATADVHNEAQREALYRALREDFASYPGAKIQLREFENGPPLEAPIAMRLLGSDITALEAAAARVEDVLRSTEGTRDVRNPSRERRTDLEVHVDREKAAVLGVGLPDVDRAVRFALAGLPAGRFREENAEESVDIRVTLPRGRPDDVAGARPGFEVFTQLYVPTSSGGAVPFRDVAELALAPSPTTLRHYDKERSTTVTAHVLDGYNTDRLTQSILAKLAKLELPQGVRLVPAGEVENASESFSGLGTASLVAAFGVLAVLVLEFRTFKSTAIVASVIPLGVIGGLIALYFSGYTLSFTAVIGFVALMGIEVKNSILLVDFTNQLRSEGLDLDTAIQKAGEVRFVPILLTSATAIGGLLPLALERSSLYSPLAIVILGGLVSSTILTRVVTPVLYKLLAPEVEHDAPSEVAATPALAAAE